MSGVEQIPLVTTEAQSISENEKNEENQLSNDPIDNNDLQKLPAKSDDHNQANISPITKPHKKHSKKEKDSSPKSEKDEEKLNTVETTESAVNALLGDDQNDDIKPDVDEVSHTPEIYQNEQTDTEKQSNSGQNIKSISSSHIEKSELQTEETEQQEHEGNLQFDNECESQIHDQDSNNSNEVENLQEPEQKQSSRSIDNSNDDQTEPPSPIPQLELSDREHSQGNIEKITDDNISALMPDDSHSDEVFATGVAQPMVYEPISTAQCETQLKAFLRNGSIPIPEDRPPLFQYVKRESINSVLSGDYENAQRYDQINQRLIRACQLNDQKNRLYVKKSRLDQQIKEAKDQLNEVREKWNHQMECAKERENQRICSLQDQQARDLDDFDDKWCTQDALRPFSKPSSRLINLRRQEKQLVLAKMFDKAKMVRAEADAVEEAETEIAQEKAECIVAQKREQLIQQQEIDLIRAKEYSQKQIISLELKRDQEIQLHESRIAKLESDRQNLSIHERVTDHDAPVLPSPRTRSRMEKYRKSAVAKRLVLRPVTANAKLTSRQRMSYSLTAVKGKK